MNTQVVTVKHLFKKPAEVVFNAWIIPLQAKRFLFATDLGMMKTVEIDAKVGGQFKIVETRMDGDAEHLGEYLEITPPTRLVFLFWVPQFSDQKTRVSIDIEPLDKGCELTLTHEGVLTEYAERTAEGWADILSKLEKAFEKAPG